MNIPKNDMREAMEGRPCAAFKAMGAVPYACRAHPQDCQCRKNGNIVLDVQNNGIIKTPHKQVVRFKQLMSSIAIGQRCYVLPLDHPSELVSNTQPALTSIVQSFESDGRGIVSFETENSIYKRIE